MTATGIDIGSRTTKVAVLSDGRLVHSRVVDTGTDPLARVRELLGERDTIPNPRADLGHIPSVVATGYGRHLAREHLGCSVVTEIRAHALGASLLFPACRTVIDVGGQDSKAIRVTAGKQANFEMNDRCAAGTGRFLEVMAAALGYTLDEFGPAALDASTSVPVNSMCTVFSESEVVSLIARGADKHAIARGLHESIVDRLLALIGRVGVEPEVVLTGGVALNPCIRALLESRLGVRLLVPDRPQLVGAIGAALSANGAMAS